MHGAEALAHPGVRSYTDRKYLGTTSGGGGIGLQTPAGMVFHVVFDRLSLHLGLLFDFFFFPCKIALNLAQIPAGLGLQLGLQHSRMLRRAGQVQSNLSNRTTFQTKCCADRHDF